LLAIVANTRGAREAAEYQSISYLGFPLSISETFQRRNTNKSIADALLTVQEIQEICIWKNKELVTYISMGFGNPYGDPYDTGIVEQFSELLNAMNVRIISLADTIGVSKPDQIQMLFGGLTKKYPKIEFGVHLHSNPATAIEKIAAGFQTVKLKIGALDWPQEFMLLQELRAHAPATELTIRVDANGAFSPSEIGSVLEELARIDIHSIEQPIGAGQIDQMKELCIHTPVPIALDEELIGVNSLAQKRALLEHIKPQYIILKPSLHGGLSGVREWIALAEERNIGWWLTSALESSIGLSAIVQFGACYAPTIPQGFGTGGLYTNNFPAPLRIQEGNICWISDSHKD
jgi:hypothetical protein